MVTGMMTDLPHKSETLLGLYLLMSSYSEPTVREGITLETHHDLSELSTG